MGLWPVRIDAVFPRLLIVTLGQRHETICCPEAVQRKQCTFRDTRACRVCGKKTWKFIRLPVGKVSSIYRVVTGETHIAIRIVVKIGQKRVAGLWLLSQVRDRSRVTIRGGKSHVWGLPQNRRTPLPLLTTHLLPLPITLRLSQLPPPTTTCTATTTVTARNNDFGASRRRQFTDQCQTLLNRLDPRTRTSAEFRVATKLPGPRPQVVQTPVPRPSCACLYCHTTPNLSCGSNQGTG